MNQQFIYVVSSYAIGFIGFFGLMLRVRRHRQRSLQFLKQSFLIQDYESDSKK